MTFWVRFDNTEYYCGFERAEIQKVVNCDIAPTLRGYYKNQKEVENYPWRFGHNTCILKSGRKASFYIYIREDL